MGITSTVAINFASIAFPFVVVHASVENHPFLTSHFVNES